MGKRRVASDSPTNPRPMKQMSVLRRGVSAASAMLLASAMLAGCGSTPKTPESQWGPERLYAEAKEEASQGNYERAGKLYERLEGRASGTVLAQQAQIERAYMLYKNGDKAQALSTLERFIKLHPTSAAIDYAYYLQGIINFNEKVSPQSGLFFLVTQVACVNSARANEVSL